MQSLEAVPANCSCVPVRPKRYSPQVAELPRRKAEAGIVQGAIEVWKRGDQTILVFSDGSRAEDIVPAQAYAARELAPLAWRREGEFREHMNFLLRRPQNAHKSELIEHYLFFLRIGGKREQVSVLQRALHRAETILQRIVAELNEEPLPARLAGEFDHLARMLLGARFQDPARRRALIAQRLGFLATLSQRQADRSSRIFSRYGIDAEGRQRILRRLFEQHHDAARLHECGKTGNQTAESRSEGLPELAGLGSDVATIGLALPLKTLCEPRPPAGEVSSTASTQKRELLRELLHGSDRKTAEQARKQFKPALTRLFEESLEQLPTEALGKRVRDTIHYLEAIDEGKSFDFNIAFLLGLIRKAAEEGNFDLSGKNLLELASTLHEALGRKVASEKQPSYLLAAVEGILRYGAKQNLPPATVERIKRVVVKRALKEAWKYVHEWVSLGDWPKEAGESDTAFFNRIGVLAFVNEKWPYAVEYFEQACHRAKKDPEVDSRDVLVIKTNLAIAYLANDQLWAGRGLLEKLHKLRAI